MNVEIIMYIISSWCVKTTFFLKKNDKLRMMHTYNSVNDITIKFNYFMRKIESVL